MARALQPGRRKAGAVRHDLRWALATLGLGSVSVVVTTLLVLRGTIPLDTSLPSAGTFAAELVVYVVLFDLYFYGLHRALHTRMLYRRVHTVHHRSTAPTVVTALAFHPVEAALILAFMPAAMGLLPTHLVSLAAVSLFLSGSILLAHCGYEVFPDWWNRVPLLNWYVTPRVHDAHHVWRNCNYSATLTIFDRAFGTLHRDPPLPE